MATFRGNTTFVYFFDPRGQTQEYDATRITLDVRLGIDGPLYEYYGQFTYVQDSNLDMVDFDGTVNGFRYVYTSAGLADRFAFIGSASLSVGDLKNAGFSASILLPQIFAGDDFLKGVEYPESGSYDTAEVLNGYDGNDVIYGYDGDDRIDGGEGNDLLHGGNGLDTLTGGIGSDTYYVDQLKDRIIEKAGEGYDKAASSATFSLRGADVEALTLKGNDAIGAVGNELNNKLVGNAAGNKMQGGAGNDALYGGLGRDALYGGLGNDNFVFDTALESRNIDTVYDLANSAGNNDTIRLDDAIFTSLTETGRLADETFALIASSSTVVSADAHILYNNANGALFYDADGADASGRVQFAVLDNHAALTSGDFLVV
jgi:Ca2+-binding RTX toxin-like protein